MTIHVQSTENKIWTVKPHGRIDVPAARSLEEALTDLLDGGEARIVLDLTEAVYITSAGLKTALTAMRQARRLGGDVLLAAMNARVREIIEMAGLHQVFVIHESVDEAVRGFGPAP